MHAQQMHTVLHFVLWCMLHAGTHHGEDRRGYARRLPDAASSPLPANIAHFARSLTSGQALVQKSLAAQPLHVVSALALLLS